MCIRDSSETIPSPQGCGCKSNIAGELENMGVSVMLAGNMGQGALNVLTAHNIKVIRGCSGNILDVATDYLNGKLIDSGVGCSSHAHQHECHGHNHKEWCLERTRYYVNLFVYRDWYYSLAEFESRTNLDWGI